MCNKNKEKCKTSKNSKMVQNKLDVQKTVIWDLINISINRRDERDVQRVVLGMHT